MPVVSLSVLAYRFFECPASVRIISLKLYVCCAHQFSDRMPVLDLNQRYWLFRMSPYMLSDPLLNFTRD